MAVLGGESGEGVVSKNGGVRGVAPNGIFKGFI